MPPFCVECDKYCCGYCGHCHVCENESYAVDVCFWRDTLDLNEEPERDYSPGV